MRTRTKRSTEAASTLPATTLTWPYIIVVVLCACLIGAGFFFAARQHFMSMENGIKISKLRQQLEGLENENRRLRLAKEVAMSPTELRRAYRTVAVAEVKKAADTFDPAPQPVTGKKVPSEPDSVVVPAALQQAPKAAAIRVSTAPPAFDKKPAAASAMEKQKRPDSLAIAKLDKK